MSHAVSRALRILGPNDLRLIWRDGFLVLILVVQPLTGLALRWLGPYASRLVAEFLALEPYYGLILGFLCVGQQPVLLGAVAGILFIEERDEGTLLALQTTPLSLSSFLGYRLVAAMVLSLILTPISVWLSGLVAVGPLELFAAAALASLTVPLVALVYGIYLQNKVQAVTAIKALQAWALLPALLYFVSTPWQWIGSVAAPLYYPIRLFTSAVDGRAEWWLVIPGIALQGGAVLWLLRRFQRTVFS